MIHASLTRSLVLAALLALPAGGASAQQGQRPAARTTPPPAQPAPPPEAQPAPYEPDLIRLSELLGGLTLLQQICGAASAQGWPDKMRALMESEGRSPAIRDRLAGAFNKGFRAYALLHRECTPVSREAATRLAREGEALSRQLAARYGG